MRRNTSLVFNLVAVTLASLLAFALPRGATPKDNRYG